MSAASRCRPSPPTEPRTYDDGDQPIHREVAEMIHVFRDRLPGSAINRQRCLVCFDMAWQRGNHQPGCCPFWGTHQARMPGSKRLFAMRLIVSKPDRNCSTRQRPGRHAERLIRLDRSRLGSQSHGDRQAIDRRCRSGKMTHGRPPHQLRSSRPPPSRRSNNTGPCLRSRRHGDPQRQAFDTVPNLRIKQ